MDNFATDFGAYNSVALSNVNSSFNVQTASTNPLNNNSIFVSDETAVNTVSADAEALKQQFDAVQDEQGILGKLWNGFKNLTGLGLGSNDVEAKIEQFQNGEITYEEALKTIESYDEKQEGAVNIIANTATGIATAGIAVATGGAGALLMGAAIGGATKAGLKTLDRATNDIQGDALDVKEIIKDGVTGAVDGAVSAATAGMFKGAVAGQTVKEAVKQGAIQGAKAGAITGAATGATDYTVNTIADGEEFTIEGLLGTTAQNAVTGAVFGGLLGGITGGIQQSKLNNKSANPKLLEADTNTKSSTKPAADEPEIKADTNASTKPTADEPTVDTNSKSSTKPTADEPTVDTKSNSSTNTADAKTSSVEQDGKAAASKKASSVDETSADSTSAKVDDSVSDEAVTQAANKAVKSVTPEQSSINGKKITIKTAAGKEIECELSIRELKHGSEKIEIIDPDGNVLGYSSITYRTVDDYGGYIPQQVEEYLGDTGALYVDLMESRLSGAHIGTELHKANILRSQELGCQGKVYLEAAWKSPTFHYKSGFRTADEATNELLAGLIEKGETINAGKLSAYALMFLPQN